MILDISPGKQIVISADHRSADAVFMQIWANKGSIGVELTKKQAIQLRELLLRAILECEN